MFQTRRFLFALAFLPIASVFCSVGFAQVYSYVDQNGIRVLTNIPPAAPVADLKVSGAILPAAAESTTKVPTVKAAPVARSKAAPSAPKSDAYNDIIQKYADVYSLDPKLIHSMIATESGFNPRAVSPKGAQGLMQLMPETAVRLGVRNPFDPEENISGGAKYMRLLLDMFAHDPKEKLVLSLAAYNAGENLVQRLGRVPAIRETNDYIRSILARYGQRTMDEPTGVPNRPLAPPTYRYLDENGVLVLTNIPPVAKSEHIGPPGGSSQSYR